MYHAFGTPLPGRLASLSVPASLAGEQLAALREDGWSLVGCSDALLRHAQGERVVAVTVDDGFADFVSAGMDLLAAQGARATLYVPTEHMGGTAEWLPGRAGEVRLLGAADVAAVAAQGVEVGSHSARHVPLDVRPEEFVADQARRSRAVLQDLTGQEVASFCYPHGYHRAATRRVVAAAGYRSALAIGHRLHPEGGDRLAVQRLMVTPSHHPGAVVDLVRQGAKGWGPPARRALAPAWRWGRRVVRVSTGRELT